MAFQPRNVIEAMIASHCVMLHEVIVDTVHSLLDGEDGPARRASRSSIVALDKAFGNNLARLDRDRSGQTYATPDTPSIDGRTETEIADRIRRHRSPTAPGEDVSMQAAQPSPATNASEADAPAEPDEAQPLGATAADAFTETWQAAAQGLNRQARRALDRKIRKRAPGLSRSAATPDRNAPATTTSATAGG
jgi:hypothetical protein